MPTHRSKSRAQPARNWVSRVKTVSTFPPNGLFTQDAAVIARGMASRKVSPKGIASGIRMIQYFINRGGRGLSVARRRELEKAKRILQERLRKKRTEGSTKSRKSRRKSR